MLSGQAGLLILYVILYISEVQGEQERICALKGSSVVMRCQARLPMTANTRWFTINTNNSRSVKTEVTTDGNHVLHVSKEGDFNLTINDLEDGDENRYCCDDDDDKDAQLDCLPMEIELRVADLQVKVIPAEEEQKVSLMCSASCPLTEKPEAYIWYKNGEFLYDDWSPWYQELVGSDEAVGYSCAIRGREDLRAPEVSVDSVTLACFSVTYAGGKICLHRGEPEDRPCSLTFPKEVHIAMTDSGRFITMSCNSSCTLVDPRATYQWYWNNEVYHGCNDQHITLFSSKPSDNIISCAVKGHEHLQSDATCSGLCKCRIITYDSRRICALEGSRVNISSKFDQTDDSPGSCGGVSKMWHVIEWLGEGTPQTFSTSQDHTMCPDNMKNGHVLSFKNLERNHSAKYVLQLGNKCRQRKMSYLPGVMLVVTGLRVLMTPSAVVTEGQRVTLTCSTSCPLSDNTTYTWHLDGRHLTLPGSSGKHLVLDPVGWEDTGNYSCGVDTQNISSSAVALTVRAREKSVLILNSVKLTLLILAAPALFLLYQWMRKRKPRTPAVELRGKVQTREDDVTYEQIPLRAVRPAARMEPAEQQEVRG